MTIVEKTGVANYAPADWMDLIRRSVESARRGDFDIFGAGDHAYARLCEVLGASENDGAWAVLAAWRMAPGISSTLADIYQMKIELDDLTTRLLPLFEAAGHSQSDYWYQHRLIHRTSRKGDERLTQAAEVCAAVCDDLAAGAHRLRLSGGADGVSVEELQAMTVLYQARATAYRQPPSETGRLLPDELLLFDLRQEWIAELA